MQTEQNNNRHAERLAHWLDDRFEIPGTDINFGVDPIISLIPGVGDWLTGALSSYFILLGVRAEVPRSVLLRMGATILLDILIGSIPLLGDIFDFGWKANTKNAQLLEKYHHDRTKTEKQSKILLWIIAVVIILAVIALLVLIGWLTVTIFEVIF